MEGAGGAGRMKLNTDMKVNRITDEVWEIPASEKPGMELVYDVAHNISQSGTVSGGRASRPSQRGHACLRAEQCWFA
jgi:RNA-splicing ligase RtcB